MVARTLPLLAIGTGLRSCDGEFRAICRSWAPGFHRTYDNYLQYAPAAVMVGLKSCGYRGRSSWGRMLVSDAIAAGTMAAAVNACKYTVRTMRPDGSTRNSFPSGHTATAFLTATMLAREYGPRSPWFAVGGYAAATVVALSRQLNDRHWMSDTVVGAGIGILAAEAGYLFADLIFKEKGRYEFDAAPGGGRDDRPSFCGIDLAATYVAGRYAAPDGRRLAVGPGAAVRAEGAWFATPHIGIEIGRAHV